MNVKMHVPCLQLSKEEKKYFVFICQTGSSQSEQGYQRVKVTWKDKQDTVQMDPKSDTKAVSMATQKLKADFTSESGQMCITTQGKHTKTVQFV